MHIDWAVYGEQNKGHAMLGGSGLLPLATALTPHTDRPGDPPHGQNWGPIQSAFPFQGHYVLLQTIEDRKAGRAGMVRTYAAFIPLVDLEKTRNLQAIFAKFPQQVVAGASQILPLEVSDQELATVPPITPRLASLANYLGASSPILPAIWPFEEPSLATITALWARIPATCRPSFAFFFQFNPEHSVPCAAQVVSTLPGLVNRWASDHVIKEEPQGQTALNLVQRWLGGAANTALLEQTLSDYEIGFTEFTRFNVLAEFAELATKIEALDFAQVRRACIVVGKYSKQTALSADRRHGLFDRFVQLIAGASVEDLLKVRNLDSHKLPELVKALQPAIRERIHVLAEGKEPVSPLVSLFEQGMKAKGDWWAKPLLQWLDDNLAQLTGPATRLVLPVLNSPVIGPRLAKAIPDSKAAESSFIAILPKEIIATDADAILALAEARRWWTFYAACLAATLDGEAAVLAHARKEKETVIGLTFLTAKLGAKTILRAACSHSLAGLTQFAGSLLARGEASLPDDCPGRVRLLTAALRATEDTVPSKLRESLRTALEPASSDKEFHEFCELCAARDPSLFESLANVEGLCTSLPTQSRQILETLLQRQIERTLITNGSITFVDTAFVLRVFPLRKRLIILSKMAPPACVAAGLRAFGQLTFLDDAGCHEWLVDYFTRTAKRSVSRQVCQDLGSLLLRYDFPETAKMIRDTVEKYHRHDVAPLDEKIRSKYQNSRTYERGASAKRVRLPRVLVATALKLEWEAVIALLGRSDYDSGLEADFAVWPQENPLFEVCVCMTGQGNVSALQISERLMRLKPRPMFAFFVGVGGARKDFDVGDVAYSGKVYYYESGKEEEDGIKARPELEDTPRSIGQLAVRVKDGWQPKDFMPKPKAAQAVIASGELVLAAKNKDAVMYQHIVSAYNDSQVVDKEAYGFMRAAAGNNIPHRMVIRGISDPIAGKSESQDKSNQPLAVKNAAAFLFALLGNADELVPRKKVKKKFFGITIAEEEERIIE